MRKIIPLVILIVVVGGYTAYWFKKADDFKHMLEQSIVTLNEHAKELDNKDTFLRYSSIQAAGYPFTMTLQIEKPVFDVPLSALLQLAPRVAGMPAAPSYEWVEEISYGDYIALSGNITGNSFTLSMAGDRSNISLIDRTARHATTGTSSTPLVCHLTVKQGENDLPWTMRPIFTDLGTFLDVFRSVDCSVGKMAVKDTKSGDILVTSDGVSFATANKPDGVYHKISLNAESKNTKATPAMDALISDYALMVNTLMGVPVEKRMVMTPTSVYGNQNLKIDMAYEGPTDSASFMDPAMHFRLDMNALNFNSDIFNFDSEVHLNSAPAGDSRNAAFVVHSKSDISPAYDQLLTKQVVSLIDQMKQESQQISKKTTPQMQFAQSLAQLGTSEQIAAMVLPQFSKFGKTAFDIDLKLKGPNNPNDFFLRSNITLDAFNWVAVPYGIKFKGSANLNTTTKMPAGEIETTCITCDALITDLGNYAMTLEGLDARMQTPPEKQHITKPLIEGIRDFLHSIAENSTAKDLVIHLVAKDTGEMTVSGKQIVEVMSLFGQKVAPYLSQQVPVAPGK